MAAQFGVNSRVKLRKLSTAGESDGWRRAKKQKLPAQGLEANSGTAAEFGKFIDDETRKWGELIRGAGLKGE